MPLGILRLNERHQRPNSRITFIKPLPGPDAPLAQDYLERVAAICHPIMKRYYLSITSLEEYEPNPDFMGRNFNNGEVIQLVVNHPRSGASTARVFSLSIGHLRLHHPAPPLYSGFPDACLQGSAAQKPWWRLVAISPRPDGYDA